MADPIAEQIAQRLGIEPERAARTVQMLVRLIQVQTRRDGRVRVPHLGVFAQTDDGLAFEPDPALADAVNHRYAGLGAVALHEESGAALPQAFESAAPMVPTSVPAAVDTAEPEPVEAASTPAGATQVVSERIPEPRRDRTTAVRGVQAEPSGGRRWAIILGLLLLAGLAALIFFFAFFDGSAERVSDFFGGEAVTAETPGPEQAASAAPLDTLAADTTAALAAEEAATPADGPRIDPAQGGWTLVTGAFPTEEEARMQAARVGQALTSGAAPVAIMVVPNTRFRYRVVVGQYESQRDAEAARRNLGDALPPDAWTLRIYPNTSLL